MKKLYLLFVLLAVVGCAKFEIEDKAATGTVNDPYVIASAKDMRAFAEEVNGGNTFEGKYFELQRSIDLGCDDANQWAPIGSDETPFKGFFNGVGNTISGIYIDIDDGDNKGLFGRVEGGGISNLTVEGTVISQKLHTGAIVGLADEGCVIDNCVNKAAVDGPERVGGIVGYGENITITNCRNEGVVHGWNAVGGIVGRVVDGDIAGCSNAASVSGGGSFIGGIVGYGYGHVYDCSNAESVSGGLYIGGIVGYFTNGDMAGCSNIGDISGSGRYVGGVGGGVGGTSDYHLIINCSNAGGVSAGGDYAGGVVGCSFKLVQMTNCYNTGDVNGYMSAAGIVSVHPFDGNSIATNCYNTGVITSDTDLDSTISDLGTIVNCYSKEGCASDAGIEGVIIMNTEQMQSTSFVDLLNNNAASYNQDNADSAQACSWAAVDGDYPILVVED